MNIFLKKNKLTRLVLILLLITIYNIKVCYSDILSTTKMEHVNLIGKALELRNEILSFLCDDGKIANVKWNDISLLSIDDKIYVTLGTNETILGLVNIKDDKVYINSKSLGNVVFTPQNITSMERQRKEIAPVFTVSSPSSQELASVRAKGTEKQPEPKKEEKSDLHPDKSVKEKEREKPQTIGEKPADVKRPEEAFLRDEKVLLKKGQIETEFNVTYLDASRQPIQTINIGLNPNAGLNSGNENENQNPTFNAALINRRVRDRSVIVPLTIRYGVTNSLLGYVTVPFAANWREISAETNGERSATHPTKGLGDVSFGINYQVLTEGFRKPDLMFILAGKSATGKGPYNTLQTEGPLGTGFWDVTSGFSVVKSYDPAVLFGSLTYSYMFEKAKIKPGDAINPMLGMGFAINDELSMSFRVLGSYIFRAKVSGKVGGETLTPFSFYFTLDKYITKNSYIEPAVSFGLTDDAPNFTFGISYVQRFR